MESKISFGFKKLPKKPLVIGAKPPQKKKLDLIECLDDQNIKIIGHVEEEEEINPLIIPMQKANKNLLDRIKDANDLKERSKLKYQKKEKVEPEDTRPDCELTIEELAARKLLEEAKAKNNQPKTTAVKVMSIAIEDQLILEGAKESTIDDYDSVPIGDFGYAMLRGMGWSEEQANKKKL